MTTRGERPAGHVMLDDEDEDAADDERERDRQQRLGQLPPEARGEEAERDVMRKATASFAR